ncbi:MAG: FtsX-like permease family protein [Gemmatimonadales bacterium]
MLAAARSVPGVQFATPAASVPFWTNEGHPLLVPGVDSVDRLGRFILQAGSPDYSRTMGTRILRGRAFDEADGTGAPHVAVVSEGMARVLWPAGDAIGRRFRIDNDTMPWITVIGIAEEMKIRTLNDAREFTYYLPVSQYPGVLFPQVLMRIPGSAPEYVNLLRGRLQAGMPADVYVRVMPLGDMVDPTMQSWRFGATMFSAFGALALLLAAVGLYSVIAYDVAQRTRDLGVRIALGASVSRIVWWVLGRGLVLVTSGILLGGAVALWIAPQLDDLLFHQPSRDPAVFGAVAAALLFVGAVAAAAPALRAARVDPNVALRGD